MNKDALTERFWDLIECSEEGYASAVRLLRSAIRPEELEPVEDELGALPEDREGDVKRIILLLPAIREEELRSLVEQMDQIGAHCRKCGAPCDRDDNLCDECDAEAEAVKPALPWTLPATKAAPLATRALLAAVAALCLGLPFAWRALAWLWVGLPIVAFMLFDAMGHPRRTITGGRHDQADTSALE